MEELLTTLDLLLGVQLQRRGSTSHHLRSGSTLLAYTDGLIERHDEHLSTGLARLSAAFATGPDDVEDLVQHLLDTLASTNDDTALIALQV